MPALTNLKTNTHTRTKANKNNKFWSSAAPIDRPTSRRGCRTGQEDFGPSWPQTFGCGRGRIVTGSHQGGFFFFAFIANDGGGTANNLIMQFQADMLNVSVVKPKIKETTSLGVAFCAGLATRVWDSVDEIKTLWAVSQSYLPRMTETERHRNWSGWNKAVLKSLGWIDPEDEEEQTDKRLRLPPEWSNSPVAIRTGSSRTGLVLAGFLESSMWLLLMTK